MNPILKFLKNWTLPFAMLCGVGEYFLGASIPWAVSHRGLVLDIVSFIQPILIFFMLFITFCKVNPARLRWCTWHGWLLLIQALSFVLLSLWLLLCPNLEGRVAVEGAMLCMICPTATAAAVVTTKLGGDAEGLTSYIIMVNIMVALIVPAMVPLVHPHPGLTFFSSFLAIMNRVFPMLICPFLAAVLVRWFLPRFHRMIIGCKDLAFYLWAVSLSLAIAVSTRSIVHSTVALKWQISIAVVSLICCIMQFAVGRLIGRYYHTPIASCQSLGQKNTVFAIWMGYTFLTPVSAIAGGFYSIWHNVFNSWQLYRKRKETE